MMESRAPRVTQCAQKVLEEIGIFDNPYFIQLQDGTMSLDTFRRTQEQFFYAVTFFSRPMAALIGRIPNPKMRLDILHNVIEEHGDFDEKDFHATTFKKFLLSIGSDLNEVDRLFLSPVLRAFNSTLGMACTFDEIEVGITCMGIIEMAFATISGIIARAVVDRGWVKEEDLVHYKLHAEIDERHAEEFFVVVENRFDNELSKYFTMQGLYLGAYIFNRLYEDLLHIADSNMGFRPEFRHEYG